MKRRGEQFARRGRWAVLACIAVLFVLMFLFGREYVGNLQVRYEIKQLERNRAELEDKHNATLNLIDSLSSRYYLEREGRLKHGLAKEGETLLVVDTNTQGAQVQSDDAPFGITALEEVPNAKRWFFYFFDKERFDYLKTL